MPMQISYKYGMLAIFIIVPIFSSEEEWIILVHGTLGLRQHLELKTFLTLFKKDISNSHYHHTIKIMRSDPFLFENQPIQMTGLHEIIEGRSSHGSLLFMKLYKQLHDHHDHVRFFTFGWSGLVSSDIRYQEAAHFYHELRSALLLYFEEHGSFPKIGLIGYSHGGNVCLNLAAVRARSYPEDTFHIDSLMLLGTPIQKETDHLIMHDIFVQIYNIYSHGDRIQTLDCFSFKRFFSKRRFKKCRRYTLPAKLKQVEVRLKHHHTDDHWVDRSPGHIELWFFGWPEHKDSLYRTHFPFHPLPFSLFLPEITHIMDECAKTDMILELHSPSLEARAWERHSYQKQNRAFMSPEKIMHVKRRALRYKPTLYSAEIYRAHIQSAVELARLLHSNNRKQSKRSLCGA